MSAIKQRSTIHSTTNKTDGIYNNNNEEVAEIKTNNNVIRKKADNHKNDKSSMIYIVFMSLVFDLMAFTIILPLLPSLLEYYRLNDNSGLYELLTEKISWFRNLVGAPERYTSVLFGGFLGSMFSFLQFLASPIVGSLSDYYGRKPLMLLCAFGICLSYFIWAMSSNFALFVLARFIGGLSKGNISLSMSVITDVSSVTQRSRGMALVGVAFSLGFIVGPIIGAAFAIYAKSYGATGGFYIFPAMLAFSLAAIDLLIIIFALKETLPQEKRVREISSALTYGLQLINVTSIFKFSAIKNVPQQQIYALRKLGFVYFLYLFLYSGLEYTVTFLMYHKFGATSMDQAKLFLFTGLIMTLLQGSVVRRLPDEKVKNCAICSLYLITPAFLFVGMAEGYYMLYTGMMLFAISTAFAVTCLTTLVSKHGNDDQKGAVLGIFRSLGALARALGPIVGSIAFWCIGSKWTYIIGGICLLYPPLALQRARI